MDAARTARIHEFAAAARPLWAENPDGGTLQEFLKQQGCDGVDAVMATMQVVGCGYIEAQRMFSSAPCRAPELAFHNEFMEAWEQSQGDV
ncbi:hypothetical protein [Streptomyces sp. NPDC051546]|uniref:hypothetical protein n=1 Tax=Streptomyces sp. NPDC051546 TaxID=3365655 RepID=UPI003799BAA4